MTASTPAHAVAWLIDSVRTRRGISVRLLNAYCLALASRDVRYLSLLADEGVNFPDGTPVKWFMSIGRRRSELDLPSPRRVRGPSLFHDSLMQLATTDTRCYFLGSTETTLERLRSRIERQYPGLQIAGMYSPPFGEITAEFIDSCELEAAKVSPDIVWIGLGTPKQDYVSTELARRLGVPCIGVGAAFDFAAGTVAEAPRWVQQLGLEWVFRLTTEPRRLWRRYLIGNFVFIFAAIRSISR